MEKKYTANQLGAIATLCGGIMWFLIAFGAGQIFGYARPELAVPIFFVLPLIPLYMMRKRPAYFVGMIVSFFSLNLTLFHSFIIEAPPWWGFTQPLLDFSFALVSLIMVVFLYFSFKSFNELKAKTYQKLSYTNNQVGAIATFLAILVFGITSQGLEVEKGIALPILLILIIIGWILLPFYIKLIKPAFILGAFISIILIFGFSFTHSMRERAEIFPTLSEISPLSIFSVSLYYFSFSIIYLIILLSVVFSLYTFRELE